MKMIYTDTHKYILQFYETERNSAKKYDQQNKRHKFWVKKIQANGFDTCCYKMLQLAAQMSNKQLQRVFTSRKCCRVCLLNFL